MISRSSGRAHGEACAGTCHLKASIVDEGWVTLSPCIRRPSVLIFYICPSLSLSCDRWERARMPMDRARLGQMWANWTAPLLQWIQLYSNHLYLFYVFSYFFKLICIALRLHSNSLGSIPANLGCFLFINTIFVCYLISFITSQMAYYLGNKLYK